MFFASVLKFECNLKKNRFLFCSTEGTTAIIDGLYQAAVNQRQKIRNYHTQPRTHDTSKPAPSLSSLIYAVFTTPQNAIPGSAVCAFKIDDIIETFEGLSFDNDWISIGFQ